MRERGREINLIAPIDDALRQRLMQIVRIHGMMFERLLFAEPFLPAGVAAQLFREVGNRYLEFSGQLDPDGDGPETSELR